MVSLLTIKQAILANFAQNFDEKAQSIMCFSHTQEAFSYSLLPWLNAQIDYPQFYFHFRDENKIVGALGAVREFFTLEEAQSFTQSTSYPLLGGVQFSGENHFFLPKILLTQENHQLCVQIFVDCRAGKISARAQLEQALAMLTKSAPLPPLPYLQKALATHADEETWCQWVEKACEAIRLGEFNKVVLANGKTFQTSSLLNPYAFLAKSETYNQGCFHFLWAETKDNAFVGSTPERLFSRQGLQLKTEALAGTAFVSDDEKETELQGNWLLHDEKNRHENTLVVDNIQQSLLGAVSDFKVSAIRLKKLRKVQHLQRSIESCLLPEMGDAQCLSRIHPTAAVAGLPKAAAMAFLAKTEPQKRHWYAGTLGLMQAEKSEFCVAIRSANIHANRIQVFAGAGIVAGSIPKHEWREIERKALGLVSLLPVEIKRKEDICQ